MGFKLKNIPFGKFVMTEDEVMEKLLEKQNKLSAGKNIVIEGGQISAPNCVSVGEIGTLLETKQNVLTAGQNISIVGNKISATGVTRPEVESMLTKKQDRISAGSFIVINGSTISANPSAFTYSKDEINAKISSKVDKVNGKGLSTNDYTSQDKQSVGKIPSIETSISGKQDKLVAGANITISGNTISSTGNVTTTELNAALTGKQDKLVAGSHITITGNTISVKSEDFDSYTKGEIDSKLASKVSAVQGKGLSTNDYTNNEKTAVAKISGIEETLQGKQDKLVAGQGISFSGNTIKVEGLEGKVDKVAGKGLSTNDYTNGDKALVATIANKQDKLVAGANISFSGNTISATGISNKVDKVAGKGLSTNDFTNSFKEKLEGVETGATRVLVDSSLNKSSDNAIRNSVVATKLEQVESDIKMLKDELGEVPSILSSILGE